MVIIKVRHQGKTVNVLKKFYVSGNKVKLFDGRNKFRSASELGVVPLLFSVTF